MTHSDGVFSYFFTGFWIYFHFGLCHSGGLPSSNQPLPLTPSNSAKTFWSVWTEIFQARFLPRGEFVWRSHSKTLTGLAAEWAQRKEGFPTVSPKIDGEEPSFSEPLEGISYIFLIFRNCCGFVGLSPSLLNVVKCPRGLGWHHHWALCLGKEENLGRLSGGKLGELFIFQGCGTEEKHADPTELFTWGSTWGGNAQLSLRRCWLRCWASLPKPREQGKCKYGRGEKPQAEQKRK